MAFNVSALANYTEENEQILVSSAVLGAKTAQLIKAQSNVLVGVKSSEKIGVMDTDAIFQTGGTCGFNASGSTTFTQREIVVGKIKINESLCIKSLEAKYLQKALTNGSTYDSFVFAQEYTDRKAEKIAEQLEKALWQGDTTSVDVNLNKFDGLAKQVTSGSIEANHTDYIASVATDITASNVVAVFDAVYKAIPAAIVDKDDVRIFCGMDTFRTYMLKLRDLNLFHYTLDTAPNSEFTLPGTTIKVIGTPGLNGTKDLYAMRLSNIYLGTDLLNEEERFELFFAKEADEHRFVVEFKMGVNVAFPAEVVKFTI